MVPRHLYTSDPSRACSQLSTFISACHPCRAGGRLFPSTSPAAVNVSRPVHAGVDADVGAFSTAAPRSARRPRDPSSWVPNMLKASGEPHATATTWSGQITSCWGAPGPVYATTAWMPHWASRSRNPFGCIPITHTVHCTIAKHSTMAGPYLRAKEHWNVP